MYYQSMYIYTADLEKFNARPVESKLEWSAMSGLNGAWTGAPLHLLQFPHSTK